MKNIDKRITEEAKVLTRINVVEKKLAGKLSTEQSATVLGISSRQMRRLRKRYEELGISGLRDGRGKYPREHHVKAEDIERICTLKRKKYSMFSVSHFWEKVHEDHKIEIGYSTLLRLLQRHGLVIKNKKRGTYRRKRPRQPMVGMRIHLDSSTHAWLGSEKPQGDLTIALDDADGRILSARFSPQEGVHSTFIALWDVLTKHGRFLELYTDRGSHFGKPDKAQKDLDPAHTGQLRRVLKQLAIRHIFAYSPQARGRSERAFGTIQRRLIAELSCAGISNYAQANHYLENVFVPAFNKRFTVPATLTDSMFRAMPPHLDLHFVLSIQKVRRVRNDFTVSFKNTVFQLPRTVPQHLSQQRVTVHQFLDGTIGISYKETLLACYTRQGKRLRLPEHLSPTTNANFPRPTLPEPVCRKNDVSHPDVWNEWLEQNEISKISPFEFFQYPLNPSEGSHV